jgi:osmotically-inducible protein OsmY
LALVFPYRVKAIVTSLAAVVVLGLLAGCIGIPASSGPLSTGGALAGATPGPDPRAGPQPMSPVQRRVPQTLDRPDLSPAEAQARMSTINLAVQQTLRVDTPPLSANVQVEQQGETTVLRGSVPDEATRIQVEQAARGSTTGGYIDNQIRVEPR